MITKKEKRKMAAQAEFLFDRIENNHSSRQDQTSVGVDEAFSRWASIYNDVKGFGLVDRLELEELEPAEIKGYMSFQMWPADEELPSWVNQLDDLCKAFKSRGNSDRHHFLSNTEPVPFEEVYSHLVIAARSLVRNPSDIEFTKDAWEGLERWLLRRLSEVLSRALLVDMKTLMEKESISEKGKEAYEEYIEHLFNKGILDVFQEYPVLGKKVVLTINQWVESVNEFVTRIESDRSEINERFNIENTGVVKRIKPDMGDRHAGGRTVFLLEFSGGEGLVYKPRCMRSAKRWSEFLQWFNSNSEGINHITPKVLTKDEYGWMEKLESSELDDKSDADDYYRRAGSLLCLLYVVGASDCHFENIISVGEYPALIDSEAVGSRNPVTQFVPPEQIGTLAKSSVIQDSVLRTLMLPFQQRVEDPKPDLAALTAIGERESHRSKIEFKNINSGEMDLAYIPDTISPSNNYPKLRGEAVSPYKYIDSIKSGFKETYLELLNKCEQGTLENVMEELFSDIKSRIIVRNTDIYHASTLDLLSPRQLKNGVEQALTLEKLLKEITVFQKEYLPILTKITDCEWQSLRQLDIPRFVAEPDSHSLIWREKKVSEEIMEESTIKIIKSNINDLSKEDMHKQLALIERTVNHIDYGIGGSKS